MKECFLLGRSKVAKDGHQGFESLFVCLKALILSLGEEVEHADKALEFLRILSILWQKLFGEIVLVVKLSDLVLLIDVNGRILVPVLPRKLSE